MVNRDDADTKVANITPFGLRLQPSLKRRVEEAAKANGRSLNSEIAARLEASFGGDQSKLEERIATLETTVLALVTDGRTEALEKDIDAIKRKLAM